MTEDRAERDEGLPENRPRGMTRRELLRDLGIGAGVLVVGGVAGYEWPHPSSTKVVTLPSPTIARGEITFKSRPDLIPPRVEFTVPATDLSPGYVLVTPSLIPSARALSKNSGLALGVGQLGLLLLDSDGRIVWFQPLDNLATNLEVQQYKGNPVLTYWHGAIQGGIGYGESVILDQHYDKVAVLRGRQGLVPDLHDFFVTPEGTALVTAYTTKKADLSPVGGPKRGEIYDSAVMEIDIASGKVLNEWYSGDHVPLTETKAKPAKGPFDYFHINSVSLWDAEHYLISARNTWALYKVHRTTGKVVWTLGGKSSSFKLDPHVQFYWQHHSRYHGNGTLTVFDDGATPQEEANARGLILRIDESAMRVSLHRQFIHPARLIVPFEGSMQLLPDGHAFIGWGALPYFSEFLPDGSLVFDGRMPTNVQSYRAFRYDWLGTPNDRPAIASERDQLGNLVVYMSWNGATEVASWEVLMGKSASSLSAIAFASKVGFETAVTVQPAGNHLAVTALDIAGNELGRSKVVEV